LVLIFIFFFGGGELNPKHDTRIKFAA